MRNKLLFILLFFCATLIFSFQSIQENTSPKVNIISPTLNVKLEWNSVVPYRITIVDQEDGNSEYNEINSNEVIMSVTYFSDSSKVKKYILETVSTRSDVLSTMASSNCFTCHKAKDKLIGPSFEEIVNRYKPTLENKAYLTQKIIMGSSGVWSDAIMPALPELETDKISQILDWIFKNAQDPNYTFYVGTEGAFKTTKRATDNHKKAVYVLHAQYTDHGLNDSQSKSKKGKHTLRLNVE
ncbi:MAG: cytochrome c [Saprospiraceae bacterium]|jgi:cytochrome c